MVEHVRHPALAAGQMKGQHRAHLGPPQPRPVGDRVVDLLDGRLPGVDHVQRLAPQRLLEPVADEAGHLMVHRQADLAGASVELLRPLHAARSVRRPPTISTRGIRYGGLKGWPTTKRPGASVWAAMSLIMNPDVLDPMTI